MAWLPSGAWLGACPVTDAALPALQPARRTVAPGPGALLPLDRALAYNPRP